MIFDRRQSTAEYSPLVTGSSWPKAAVESSGFDEI
jgi:hypothetical protein